MRFVRYSVVTQSTKVRRRVWQREIHSVPKAVQEDNLKVQRRALISHFWQSLARIVSRPVHACYHPTTTRFTSYTPLARQPPRQKLDQKKREAIAAEEAKAAAEQAAEEAAISEEGARLQAEEDKKGWDM